MTVFSRGEIHHTLIQDFMNVLNGYNPFNTIFLPPDPLLTAEASRILSIFYPHRHSLLVPYARTAFYYTLKALGLEPGSRILTTPITIYPFLDIIHALELEPVFIDIEMTTFSVDIEQLEAHILRFEPSCFLLTYLFGLVPDIERISSICLRHDVFLIEDFSQAIGASFKGMQLGNFGDVSIYSASITKFVDSYNGGFMTVKSTSLHKRISDLISSLPAPSPSRVRKIVRSTLITNVLLSIWGYVFITYPLLRFLKLFSPTSYLKLVGPRIFSELQPGNRLPSYYFESISTLQARQLLHHFVRLQHTLEARKSTVKRVLTAASLALAESSSSFTDHLKSLLQPKTDVSHVFWQVPIHVCSTESSQSLLFRYGIETGTTNLPLLSEALANDSFPNALALKRQYIFVPLHRHLSVRRYSAFFRCLLRGRQL